MKNNIIFITIIWFLLSGFSSNDKNNNVECRPAINFTGSLKALCGSITNVEQITISGLYEKIKVYGVTCSDEIDPTLSKTEIALKNIKTIYVFNPEDKNPVLRLRKFKNKEYVQVDIEWHPGKDNIEIAPDSYLMDADSKIICVENKDRITLKKEVGIKGVISLEINKLPE